MSLNNLYRKQAAELEAMEQEQLRATIEMFAKSERGLAGDLLKYANADGTLSPSTALNKAIQKEIDALTANLEEHIVSSITEAAVMAQGHVVGVGSSLYKASVSEKVYMSLIGTPLSGVPEGVVKAAMERVWDNGMKLKDSIWADLNPELLNRIENKIVISIAQGQSVVQTAREISKECETVERWKALRLVRNETRMAYREGYIESGKQRDWVTGFQWETTSGNPCDECLALVGEYSKDDVPNEDSTHPNCFCRLTTTTLSVDEFTAYLADKYSSE